MPCDYCRTRASWRASHSKGEPASARCSWDRPGDSRWIWTSPPVRRLSPKTLSSNSWKSSTRSLTAFSFGWKGLAHHAECDVVHDAAVLLSRLGIQDGGFDLQVSLREKPTLSVETRPLIQQSYFRHLEFPVAEVPSLDEHEIVAEKSAPHTSARRSATCMTCLSSRKRPLDRELVRRLVVINSGKSETSSIRRLLSRDFKQATTTGTT